MLDKTIVLETSNSKNSTKTHEQLFKLERRFIRMICEELGINKKQFRKMYKSKKPQDQGFANEINKQFKNLKESYMAEAPKEISAPTPEPERMTIGEVTTQGGDADGIGIN